MHQKINLKNIKKYAIITIAAVQKCLVVLKKGEISSKVLYVIYFDLECLLKKEQSCQNFPEKSYAEKKATHEASGWTMFIKK